MSLTTCQAIYGEERGGELSTFLEHATGEPCPCKVEGATCPLMPADVVSIPTPRLRGELGELRVVASAALAGYGLAVMKVGSVF